MTWIPEWLWHHWPSDTESSKLGQFGDYVGGVIGTAISVFALFVVLATWIMTRSVSRMQVTTSILAEMLKTHDAIASESEHGFWSRSGTPAIVLREFSAIYKITKRVEPSRSEWNTDDRIDISYTYAYYGLNTTSMLYLEKYGFDRIKNVHDQIAKLTKKSSGKFSGLFKGHQATLSQYFRNLFGMYTFVDAAPISHRNKKYLGKVVRTKLSNYDQAILARNTVSHLGREWEAGGIVRKYKPFSNIPEHFFGVDRDIDLKKRFPVVDFEWERHTAERRPRYLTLSLGRWSLTLMTQSKG